MVLTGIVPVVHAGQTASKFRMPSSRLPVSSWHCCAVVSSGCPLCGTNRGTGGVCEARKCPLTSG